MKASVKLRDDQKPLVRAKVPLSIVGLPFVSGISAGETRELQLDLATAFESGPALRVSYRPNDAWNPFGLIIKTGIGLLGSPVDAPMTMSAEFNMLGRGNPSFLLRFKPQIGDFCIRKWTSSVPPPLSFGKSNVVDRDTDGEGSAGGVDSRPENGIFSERKANGFVPAGVAAVATYSARAVDRLISGVELTARSVLPLKNRAAVKFQWGMRIPSELCTAFTDEGGSSGRKRERSMPYLVMRKISVEYAGAGHPMAKKKSSTDAAAAAEVAEACLSVRNQMDELKAESGMLRKAMEELRSTFAVEKQVGHGGATGRQVAGREAGREEKKEMGGESRNGGRGVPPPAAGKSGRRGEGKERVVATTKEDVNEELRKALMDATGSGA